MALALSPIRGAGLHRTCPLLVRAGASVPELLWTDYTPSAEHHGLLSLCLSTRPKASIDTFRASVDR